VKAVEKRLAPSFKQIPLINWKEWESVEQPEYILQIRDNLQSIVSTCAKYIVPTHFEFFCDSVATQIIKNFDDHVLQIRGISDIGAEQILLDVTTIKAALLKLPSMIADESGAPPPAASGAKPVVSQKPYLKHVDEMLLPLEKELQIVMAPADALVHTYKTMYHQPTPAHFVKLLDLKGVPKTEQEAYLDKYGVPINDAIRVLVRNQIAEEGEFGKKLSNLLKIKT